MTAPKPDFFIAGAAKCGTTALFNYLAQHPGIFMPSIKEPNFFCTDLQMAGRVESLHAYENLFARARAGVVTGEASTMYLYSKVAVERVVARNPLAKIIVMLRYPVDAAHSLHAARWSHGHENIESFEDAWRVQDDRLRGKYLPRGWPDPATLQYGSIYRYAPQVRRLLDHVPRGQCCFVLYEDFFSQPTRYYAQILEFLNVAPNVRVAFHVINSAVGPRWKSLDRWLREPPAWIEKAYALVRPVCRAVGLRPKDVIRGLNSTTPPARELPPAFRAELEAFFSEDIAELERLLARPLWRDAAAGSGTRPVRATQVG